MRRSAARRPARSRKRRRAKAPPCWCSNPPGLDGKLKTARKGVGDYTVTVHGRAAHAGLDFEKGASAIVEMARQIERIAGFTRLDRGITVSPGVIRGGTRSNVIAAECSVEIDVRVPRAAMPATWNASSSLKPFDKRCTITCRRPEPAAAGAHGRRPGAVPQGGAAGARDGRGPGGIAAGGGSDGNFTAALGVPTLDGLGAVGEGAHAPNESILIGRMADRSALLAKLVAAL